MTTPQPGIFAEETDHHHYLEYTVAPDGDLEALNAAIAGMSALCVHSTPAANVVLAFGPALWARLSPDTQPDGLVPFEAIEGVDGHTAPATQRDIFVWIHGVRLDQVFDAVLHVQSSFKTVANLAFEERGFIRHESRDLTGFIDGSANPKDEAAREAALIPAGRTGAGGAFVLSQQWVHDLDTWSALPRTEQEGIIGRTKPDSIELEGDAMPSFSHVSRTDASEDGVALKIYRRSAPFGTAGRHGLYFLAFSCDPHRFDVQLRRMYGISGDGEHDHLIGFSQAVSGSYWFAPSVEDLVGLLSNSGKDA
ncbi:MAG: Dyp-type peroxidase [Alphaproteobacteria bacterium]|jgi:porphyrinogen peroxidase|nr:Dyp-type peroxidase [Alphaproteobacteria bacterium]MBT7942516.1 Dyp-type peroxidase [Alphaproteobacteria bacterium]